MKKKRVLVTGAGGYLGSHLVERLVKEGAQVTALVHYNSRNDYGLLKHIPKSIFRETKIIFGDLQDEYLMEKICRRQDVVFHLAALVGIPYSYFSPESYVYNNIYGSHNIFKSALRGDVGRVIFTSTAEVYGTTKYLPIDEDHPLQCKSPYAASKVAAEKLAESYYMRFGLPIIISRAFNTFGPRQSQRAVISTIIAQALKSHIIKLGSLMPSRDFNYCTNLVDFWITTAQKRNIVGQVFNVGYGRSFTIAEIVKKVASILGKKLEVRIEKKRTRPPKTELMKLVCNFEKARKVVGYKPRISLEEGLKRTIAYAKENPQLYIHTEYLM
jgi:NAD dependent epimerase/dehydratase